MRAKITADHLERTALVYVRQSTPGQVRDHTESRRRQYGLVDVARELGFHRVETIGSRYTRRGREGRETAERSSWRYPNRARSAESSSLVMRYRSFAASACACFKSGTSVSACFHRVRKSW